MSSSPEYRTMRQCIPRLINACQSNLIAISAGLFSRSLIPQTLHEEMSYTAVPRDNRASRLVNAVISSVEENCTKYNDFIEVLRDTDSAFYRDILTELQTVLESFRQVDSTGSCGSSSPAHHEQHAQRHLCCGTTVTVDSNQDDGLLPSINERLERNVEQEIEELEDRFATLTQRTLEYLKCKHTECPNLLDRVRSTLAHLPGSKRRRHIIFLGKYAEKILRAQSFDDIFLILSPYWNFYNSSLLDLLVSSFGDEVLREEMEKYNEDLQRFRRTTRAIDIKALSSPSDHVTVSAALDVDSDTYTLEDEENIRKRICMSAMIDESFLQLSDCNPGSVRLTWSILTHDSFMPFFADAISNTFLKEKHILTIDIDGIDLETFKEEHPLTEIPVDTDELSENFLLACEFNFKEDILYLLQEMEIDVDTRNETGLIVASAKGNVEIVEELIKAGASLDAKDVHGNTALDRAEANGHESLVRILIRSGNLSAAKRQHSVLSDTTSTRGLYSIKSMHSTVKAESDLEELIQKVSKHIGIQWKALARAHINHINTDFSKVDLEELIQEVSRHIGIQWKALARALGFVQTDIDAIEYNNLLNLKEQIHQLFHKWKQQEGIDATSRRLLDGIRKAGLDDLIETLREKEYVKPSSASLAASLAAGARASSGHQILTLGQQTSQEPAYKDSGKKSLPVATSPVDAERERVRQKRLTHQSNSSRAQNNDSSSSLPQSAQAGVKKDSTAKASNSRATATSQSSSKVIPRVESWSELYSESVPSMTNYDMLYGNYAPPTQPLGISKDGELVIPDVETWSELHSESVPWPQCFQVPYTGVGAAGARASSGHQILTLGQQTSQEPAYKDSGKKSSPVVTSPVDAERERVRQKRLEHLSNYPNNSGAQNIDSPSSVPHVGVEKDSTAKASDSRATTTSQSLNESFEVGHMIKVSWHGEPRYGVIQWLGKLELSGDLVRTAGVEMEERVEGGHSGTFNGNQYFSCDDGHGLLLPVHKLERDDRFDSPAVPSTTPQRQTPLTETPVAQFHVGIGRSNSSNVSSSQFSTPMSPQQQGANFSSTASAQESALQRLLSDPSFTEAYNEMRGNESPMQQHHEPTAGTKLLVFCFPKDRGGLVVGRDGKNIQEVERETNTSINIDRSYTGGNGKGTIIGSEENCKRALALILTNLERRISQRLATIETVIIPNQQMAGRVIGKGGRTREAIEKLSGAKLEIKKPEEIDFFLSEIQHCKITGSAEQIEEAKKLIDRAMLGADIAGEATTAAVIVKLASHLGFQYQEDPEDLDM